MKTLAAPMVLLGITLSLSLNSVAGDSDLQTTGAREPTKDSESESLRNATTEALIARARDVIRGMGTYRARLIKTERIKGEARPPQTIDVLVCQAPHAVRLEYVAGPKAGRRVIWRQDRRPTEILVREAGLLGLTSLWLDASGGLARGDTNHAVSEIGFTRVLDLMEQDAAKARASGGHLRKDLGRGQDGLYHIEWLAPAGAAGLYARRLRLAIDMNLHVPVDIQVFDAHGFLERYQYTNVRARQVCRQADVENL